MVSFYNAVIHRKGGIIEIIAINPDAADTSTVHIVDNNTAVTAHGETSFNKNSTDTGSIFTWLIILDRAPFHIEFRTVLYINTTGMIIRT